MWYRTHESELENGLYHANNARAHASYMLCLPQGKALKVPVRSNFRKFIFLDFSKVYVAVTYPARPFFDPSTGSPFFPTVFLVILRPPLIGHVPTAQ